MLKLNFQDAFSNFLNGVNKKKMLSTFSQIDCLPEMPRKQRHNIFSCE